MRHEVIIEGERHIKAALQRIFLILAAECGRSEGAPSPRWKRTPEGAWVTYTLDREVDWRILPPGPDEPHRLKRWRDGFRTVREFDSMRAAMEWADANDGERP